MFKFFKKKTEASNSLLNKRIQSMKCRKLNFVDEDYDKLCREAENNISALLKLKPVNYYAVKHSYIMCKLYSSEDFSENYTELIHFEGEKQTFKSKLYIVDTKTAVNLLSKVGIMIELKNITRQNENK